MLNAALQNRPANTQRSGFCKHNFFQSRDILWSTQHAQNHAWSILLHLDWRRIHVQCAVRHQSLFDVSNELSGHIVKVRFQQSDVFGISGHRFGTDKQPQDVGSIRKVHRSRTIAHLFDDHCWHGTE